MTTRRTEAGPLVIIMLAKIPHSARNNYDLVRQLVVSKSSRIFFDSWMRLKMSLTDCYCTREKPKTQCGKLYRAYVQFKVPLHTTIVIG